MTRLVLPLIIRSGISTSYRHLFISVASLSLMDVNFLKPEFVHAIKALRFPVGYFLSVAVSKSRCIFTLVPCSIICYAFSIFFIHSAFVMISPFPYFAPKSLCHSHSVLGMSSPIFYLLGRILFSHLLNILLLVILLLFSIFFFR